MGNKMILNKKVHNIGKLYLEVHELHYKRLVFPLDITKFLLRGIERQLQGLVLILIIIIVSELSLKRELSVPFLLKLNVKSPFCLQIQILFSEKFNGAVRRITFICTTFNGNKN
jgi:hypothetical protein